MALVSSMLRPAVRVPFGVRFQTNLPSNTNGEKNLPTSGDWKHLKQHIPGESVQKDDLRSRIPTFPLTKETVPTLLPRPGVPQVGPKHTFRQVIQILKNKKQPELIYESEPHRLYFFACFCCGVVFAVYGVMLLEFAWFQANREYEQNERELDGPLRTREWLIHWIGYSLLGGVVLAGAVTIGKLPTRLIRRMWYLPGPVEHIRFTSYPLFPGLATPVHTVPLKNLTRRRTAKVWTGKGFYGTADKAMFSFVLKETGERKKTWIVDRKGFFWSDGRVFDFLFGKESLADAEAGIPYDEKVGMLNKELKKKRQQLKLEHGFFYNWKLQAREMKKDAKHASSYVLSLVSSSKNNKKRINGSK